MKEQTVTLLKVARSEVEAEVFYSHDFVSDTIIGRTIKTVRPPYNRTMRAYIFEKVRILNKR